MTRVQPIPANASRSANAERANQLLADLDGQFMTHLERAQVASVGLLIELIDEVRALRKAVEDVAVDSSGAVVVRITE